MCIDPYASSNYSILGSVQKAVKYDNLGTLLKLKNKQDVNYLNSNFFINSQYAEFYKIKQHFKKYFKNFDKVKYMKSFSIIRSTKKNLNDARITTCKKNKNLIIVHSGKWINCFNLGKKISNII